MRMLDTIDAVRRIVQDTASKRWTDGEIAQLVARNELRLYGSKGDSMNDTQHEALVVFVAFQLLQARDAAGQLEALATVQG